MLLVHSVNFLRKTERTLFRGRNENKNRKSSTKMASKISLKAAKGQECKEACGGGPRWSVAKWFHPGKNVGLGKDHTLFFKIDGIIKFEKFGPDKKKVVLSAFDSDASLDVLDHPVLNLIYYHVVD
ncbi:50S ribosomal L27, chloroplastic [Olea europaea subsp. europaea]|uniref:50S ribosomal L27, chloroplastic n=1 Tax=Olea europaea subsp. europaea TaxID=158383 RepID=A0A8S0TQS6_OLEEU|nr:50S ribosomal L27, chloroplastic [Olea europaea subsp. europaea]